jgi:hypothetical protein
MLRGTALPITLMKYAQQEAEPQNKNYVDLLCATLNQSTLIRPVCQTCLLRFIIQPSTHLFLIFPKL